MSTAQNRWFIAIEEVLTYLQDVLDAINDMESYFVDFPNRFDLFEKDRMRKCVVERKTEIMGEAINRIRKAEKTKSDSSFLHVCGNSLSLCMDQ